MGAFFALFGSSSPRVTCHQWRELNVACPAKGCSTSKFAKQKWTHSGCGGRTEINSQALLRCRSHTEHPYLITNAYWDCGNHSGEFRKTDLTKLTAAMTIAGSFYSELGETVWVSNLIDSIANLK